jgi:hypothetical protein
MAKIRWVEEATVDASSERLLQCLVSAMKPRGPAFLSIDRFPVPWAGQLPNLLGATEFLWDGQPISTSNENWLGIISSHDSKLSCSQSTWQAGLLDALLLAARNQWRVLCAVNTPYFPSIEHNCARLGIRWTEIHVVNGRDLLPDHSLHPDFKHESLRNRLLLHQGISSSSKPQVPFHDLAATMLAHRVFAISIRNGGKVAKIVEQRLKTDFIPPGTTYLSMHGSTLSGNPKSNHQNQNDWLQRGAIGWLQSVRPTSPTETAARCRDRSSPVTYQPLLGLGQFRKMGRDYLIHCTRARGGPWPDQSIDQFRDEALHAPWPSEPQPIATLERILRQQRLIATDHLRRSQIKTVCFSAQPLERLLSMRRFRSHLGRWDWEPYGMMIERSWLVQQGARPVRYVDSSTATNLDDAERAYIQVVSYEKNSIDWSQEQEWRIADDIRLPSIPFEKAMVFVASTAEARAIQSLSRWPIVVVGE